MTVKQARRHEVRGVARKRKKRRTTRRPAIAPWIVLAASLSVIGFACTRTAPTARQPQAAQHPIAQATPAPQPPPFRRPAGPPAIPPASSIQTVPSASPATAMTSAPAGSKSPLAADARSPALAAATGTPAPTQTPPPSEPPKGAPRLALIIDDCGQWLDTERGFIALPIALTLSVLPDVRYNQTIEREAAQSNKGVMLHLPMETLSGLNPGPGKITTEMNDAAIAAQVERDLTNVDLATGVNNHEGSKATANPRVMNDLMTVLAAHRRFFIDSRTNSASVAEQVAAQHGVATAARDVFIDNRADVAYTEAQLRAAAVIAERDGSAIAIGHPRPTTLLAVRAMIPELQAAGITFELAADAVH